MYEMQVYRLSEHTVYSVLHRNEYAKLKQTLVIAADVGNNIITNIILNTKIL